VVGIIQIKHIATEWPEKCGHPRLLLASVQFVFGKTPIFKSKKGIVIARDEPGCLAIREFQWEHRSLGPELRIERIRICLEFRF